jgi:peptidoglycan/LPS O-acetylase OafA/YrhL
LCLIFFSNISFSLYLTHTTIGGKIVNLGLRFVNSTAERYGLFLMALAASIAFAYLFYIVIEKKAIAAGKKIKYQQSLFS